MSSEDDSLTFLNERRTVTEISYTESHKYQGKGAEYEQYYQTQAWQKFLW